MNLLSSCSQAAVESNPPFGDAAVTGSQKAVSWLLKILT
jgi:hypothetical protein